MSGSRVTYDQEELKDLLRLLKNLPHTIPIGEILSDTLLPMGRKETKRVAARPLSVMISVPRPGLEQVVEVLRSFITGNGGPNALLTQWVDDLRHAARVAIEVSGDPNRRRALRGGGKIRPETQCGKGK
ncbi:hypothetical protein K438DRAFT_1748363 [Mycena galopus ATCC 62051]|nr:hypothetical protein K438DRAFT_1748363 [Mycena galopus ATCC 62051]